MWIIDEPRERVTVEKQAGYDTRSRRSSKDLKNLKQGVAGAIPPFGLRRGDNFQFVVDGIGAGIGNFQSDVDRLLGRQF